MRTIWLFLYIGYPRALLLGVYIGAIEFWTVPYDTNCLGQHTTVDSETLEHVCGMIYADFSPV